MDLSISSSAFAQQAQSYTDLASLNKVTELAKTDESAALKDIAKQFESIFLNIALKSMRDANAAFAEGNFLNSNQSEMYQGMFDNQLSLTLSQNGGFGLADSLIRQMERNLGDATPRTGQSLDLKI